jgi:hypothetical protein
MIKDFKILLFIVALFFVPIVSPILVTHSSGDVILAATPVSTASPTRTPSSIPSPCVTGKPLSVEAEDCSNYSGIVKNGTYINSCDEGDWVSFNLYVGCGHYPPKVFTTNVAVSAGSAGKIIEFHKDSPTGTLIGTMILTGTGGSAPNFAQQIYQIPGSMSGTNFYLNLYLVFKGGANIADFDWFRFDLSGSASPTPTPTVKKTPTPTVPKTPTPTAGGTITPTPTKTGSPTPSPIADTLYIYQVVTGEATNITSTTASLSASAIRQLAHPNAYPIMTYNITMALLYWEESNPANKITAGAVATSGAASYPLTVDVTGLKPATTYMFQAIVRSGSTSYPDGEVKSFQTLGGSGGTPTVTPPGTPTPINPPTPTPGAGNIKVQFYNQSTAATSNQIYLNIKLFNTGTSSINLSNVKLRYYYTVDGAKPQAFYCDYSPLGSANATGTFITMPTAKVGADTYVEIGFTAGAGSLAAGGNTTIQARVAKNDWSNYTQTNDYSFNSTATTYVDWTKVTGYVSEALQWGVEP